MAQVKKLREITGAPISECKEALLASESGPAEELLSRAQTWLRKKGVAVATKRSARDASEGLVAICFKNREGCIIEVNSETDFAARSDSFRRFVAVLAHSALDFGANKADGALELASLAKAPLASNPFQFRAQTVEDAVTDMVSSIRENLQIRRATKISVPTGLVWGYMHSSVPCELPTVSLGGIGALIALSCENKSVESKDVTDLGKKIAMHVVAASPPPRYLDKSSVPSSVIESENEVIRAQVAASGRATTDKALQGMLSGRVTKFYQESCLLEQPFLIGEETGKAAPKVSQVVEKISKQIQDSTLAVRSFVRYKKGESE